MAIADLIFKRKQNELSTIQIDVTISENHTYTSIVAKHRVESGSDITDHIKNNPPEITMKGFITNTPVGLLQGKIGTMIRGGDFDRAKTAKEEMLLLRDSKTPFDILTTLGNYTNMVFSELSFDRDSTTVHKLNFSATLIQIELVTSETVKFDTIRDEFKDKASDTVNTGAKATGKATADQIAKASFLARIMDFLGRFLK